MPVVNPFETSDTQTSQPVPPTTASGLVNPFADSGTASQVPAPGGPPGVLGPVLGAGRWALGEIGAGARWAGGEIGAGIKDILRGLRVPQQVLAIALADFVVKNHRLPSVPEWRQYASEAVRQDKSFEDVLADWGLPPSAGRTILAMIGDIGADPLWFSPAKAAKLARLPQLIQALKDVKLADTGIMTARQVTRLGDIPAKIPGVKWAARKFWDPYYGYDPKFVQFLQEQAVGRSHGWEEGIKAGQTIAKLTPEEQQYVTRYMELGLPGQYGRVVAGREFLDTPEQAKLIEEARAKGLNADRIQAIGRFAKTADLNQLRELVEIGAIPKAAVDPFHMLPGKYLPGIGPDQERYKAMTELFRTDPMKYAKLAAKENALDMPLISSHIRREYRFWEDPEGFVKKLAQKDPQRAAILEQWWRTRAGMSASGSYRPFALNFGFLQPRDPKIDEIIREAMGEIREAAHPIATSLIEGRRFIELWKFLQKTADNFGIDHFREGYIPVPKEKMWGPLAGKWLPKDIGEEILKTVGKDDTGLARLLRKARIGVGWWKYGKIVLSPASHARIILHNALLWDFSGAGGIMKTHRLMRSFRALMRGEKDPLYQAMKKSGVVLHNTFHEQLLDDMLSRDPEIIEDPKNWGHVLHNLTRASLNLFRNSVGRYAEAALAFEERLFKGAIFDQYRSLGKSIEESARLTNEAMLNYKRMPEFWNMIRQFGIVPFAAFPLQATSRIGRALIHRPAVVGKYGKIFRDIETARSGLSPEEIAQEKSVLPPEMDQGVGWIRLGRKADGSVRYLNISYVMPLWILPETLRGVQAALPGSLTPKQWSSAMQAGFLNISAYPLAKALIEGVDPFTNKRFQSFSDVLGYLYKFATPPLIGTFPQQMWAAAHGTPVDVTSQGKPKNPFDVAARYTLGWVVRDVDPVQEKIWRMRELQRDIQDTERELKRLAAAPYLTEEDRDRLMAEQLDRIRAIVDMLSRVGAVDLPEDGAPTPATEVTPQSAPAPAGSGGLVNPFQ